MFFIKSAIIVPSFTNVSIPNCTVFPNAFAAFLGISANALYDCNVSFNALAIVPVPPVKKKVATSEATKPTKKPI